MAEAAHRHLAEERAMNDIQKHLLKLLLEIDDICRENEAPCSL